MHELLPVLNVAENAPRALVTWNSRPSDPSSLRQYFAVVAFGFDRETIAYLVSQGFAYTYRFAVIPGLTDARWFVPLGSRRAAAATFALYSPLKKAAKLRKAGVQLASRLGLPGWYRDKVLIALRQPSMLSDIMVDFLGDSAMEVAISSGTPGPTRKPTLATLSPDGIIRGIVKAADTPVTRTLLRNESSLLQSVKAVVGSNIEIPSILHQVETGQRLITVQSALNGHHPSREFTSNHRRFLDSLRTGSSGPALYTELARSLPIRASRIQKPGLELGQSINLIQTLLEGYEIPHTVNHGDFTPWNLKENNGRLGAFDWESGWLDGLPLQDEIHYNLQVGFLLDGWGLDQAMSYLLFDPGITRFETRQPAGRGLQLVYLVNAVIQRHEAMARPNDPALQRYYALLRAFLS